MTRPLPPKIGPTEGGMGHAKPSGFCGLPGFEPKLSAYRIYLNRRRGVYFIFRNPAAAFIRGRRLFEGGVYSKITLFSTKYRTTYANFFTR